MFSVKQSFSAPDSFQPPFKADVLETYQASGHFKSVKEGMEQIKNTPNTFINFLVSIRNAAIKSFGFKTEYSNEGYGPFDVQFLSDDHCSIKYDENNFSFYGEIIKEQLGIRSHFAVKFHTKRGRLYFYTIFPGHYLIFKYLITKFRTAVHQ